MNLFFVDCEAAGPVPALGRMTEFGIAAYPSRDTFHGILLETKPDPQNPAIPVPTGREFNALDVATRAVQFIDAHGGRGRAIMVSDNPAYDFMWMADLFWRMLNRNPFGFSARRIGDFYAGLVGDFTKTQKWKDLRVTVHDHNPVHDALGNLEAFERMLNGER